MKYLVVIPARFDSSRLPGKPLIELNGLPMIIRTYRQCLKVVPAELICVATDDDRIHWVCEAEGIRVVRTSRECLTGTDRVAEVARHEKADVFINIQGDEPIFNPADLVLLLKAIDRYPEEVINGYSEITASDQINNASIPKVVFRPDGRLLYMSRAAIPGSKNPLFNKAWRQICAYSFPRSALLEFSSVKIKPQLESIEDIEILRFLELGRDVRMIEMSDQSISVDNPDDIPRVEIAINHLGL